MSKSVYTPAKLVVATSSSIYLCQILQLYNCVSNQLNIKSGVKLSGKETAVEQAATAFALVFLISMTAVGVHVSLSQAVSSAIDRTCSRLSVLAVRGSRV
jgi:hypothetical protein